MGLFDGTPGAVGLFGDLNQRALPFTQNNQNALMGAGLALMGGDGWKRAGQNFLLGGQIDQQNARSKFQDDMLRQNYEWQKEDRQTALQARQTAAERLNQTQAWIAKNRPDLVGAPQEVANAALQEMFKQNKTKKPFAVSGVGVFDPSSNQYIMPPGSDSASGLSPAGDKKYNETKGKNIADAEAARGENISGAIGFLTKAGQTQGILKGMSDSEFGPVQGSEGYRYVPTFGWTDMAKQDEYKGSLSSLELDVAKMKLKGQGQVTEAERKIARDTLGGLTVADKATASKILKNTTKEAAMIVIDALEKGEVTVAELEQAGIDVNGLIASMQDSGADAQDVNALIDQYAGR